MKKLILVAIAFLFAFQSFSQARLNAPGNFFMHKLNQLETLERLPDEFIEEYDLVSIDGEYCIGVLGLVNESTIDENALEELGVRNDTRIKDLWTFRVPVKNMNAFITIQGLKMLEIAEPVSPFLDESLPSARVDSVHQGLGGLNKNYKGRGVVVAVIDWGFDYTHPVFYDFNLDSLRLVRAWDQNKFNGTPPQGYNFGVEYVGEQQLLAAQQDTDYVFGPGTHGTHVAGIAGGAGGGPNAYFGSDNDVKFMGAAPESELIFISLRRDAPSLIDGFNYVKDYAESVGKPFVVNMSFGSHLGPHDGMDLKNIGIDNLHGPGRIFVGSAGNNGTGNFHLDRDFNVLSDTLKTVVNIHNSSDWGQTLSMWGSPNSSFSASIALVDGSNNIVHQTPFYQTEDEPQVDDIIDINGEELHIRVQSTSSFTTNNKPNIRLEVRNTSNYKIVLLAASEDSHLHIWSNARMQNRYTNWGSNLTNNYPDAVGGNTDYGLGEPAGVGKNVTTVGAYRAEYIFNNQVYHGNIASFSSEGPTVDERVKPDISSCGVGVTSSINSHNSSGFNSFEHEGNNYQFDDFSGTSMSGPLVAGIVALMLEVNPQLDAVTIKEILKSTARLDNRTGDIDPETGDLKWGWGKANALAAILAVEAAFVSVPEAQVKHNYFNIFPNPASSQVTIEVNDDRASSNQVKIFDLNGKLVFENHYNSGNVINVDVNGISNGVYLVQVYNETSVSFQKLVISK